MMARSGTSIHCPSVGTQYAPLRTSYSVRWPSETSQQGTPFGAVTPLNQARMSGGTLSYCPLSKASAAPVSAETHASRASCASHRIRSSTAFISYIAHWLVSTIRVDAIKHEL